MAESGIPPVETGITGVTDIEITKGLQQGERLCGSYKLCDAETGSQRKD